MRATPGAAAGTTWSSILKSSPPTSFAFDGRLVATGSPETSILESQTCLRFEMRRHVASKQKRRRVAALRNPQKSSGTLTRLVLKLFTVFTKAGEALRANH